MSIVKLCACATNRTPTTTRRYDMAAKKDFFKEVKLAGSLSELKYTITQAIGGKTGVTLSSVQQGIDLKAVGDSENMLTTVSATGSAGVGGVDIRYEPSYAIAKKLTKLKLSSAIGLGSGFTASGSVSATSAKDVDYDVELGYKSSLSEVRANAPRFLAALSIFLLLCCISFLLCRVRPEVDSPCWQAWLWW